MTDIVTFGNCQARGIASLLDMFLPDSYEVPEFLSNNLRTAEMKSPDVILTRLSEADVVVFQPLHERHGQLSGENVRAALDDSVTAIGFPYIFNSGIAGFCHAGRSKAGYSYGKIFGQEVIFERLERGASGDDLIDEYIAGELELRVRQRFDHCMDQMSDREHESEIVLTDFIYENYRDTRMFLMHNHPSTALYAEICAQLRELTGLPIDVGALRSSEDENLADHHYKPEKCPTSPRDLEELGCTFPAHPDWQETGSRLIRMIADEWERNSSKEPHEAHPERARA
jgi:Polysaccharide biosynthesis enzyme WcbI